MITYIRLSNLRNNDYAQFMQNFLDIVNRFDPNALQVNKQYLKLQELTNTINALVNTGTGSAITDELVVLDALRDDAINGILGMINGFQYSKDEATKKAAALLSNHLAGFGPAIARETLQNETNKIRNIIRDWTGQPELAAALTLLGLNIWKADLEEANVAFDTRYVDRSVSTGTANSDKASDMRPAVNAAYLDLRDHVDACYTVNEKVDPWATAVAAVNDLIKDYNDLMASRGNGGEDGAAPPSTPK